MNLLRPREVARSIQEFPLRFLNWFALADQFEVYNISVLVWTEDNLVTPGSGLVVGGFRRGAWISPQRYYSRGRLSGENTKETKSLVSISVSRNKENSYCIINYTGRRKIAQSQTHIKGHSAPAANPPIE
jgi:hypothetical protein